MTLTGWCEGCHRIRRVRVRIMTMVGGAFVGLCAECEARGLTEAQTRHPAGQA